MVIFKCQHYCYQILLPAGLCRHYVISETSPATETKPSLISEANESTGKINMLLSSEKHHLTKNHLETGWSKAEIESWKGITAEEEEEECEEKQKNLTFFFSFGSRLAGTPMMRLGAASAMLGCLTSALDLQQEVQRNGKRNLFPG